MKGVHEMNIRKSAQLLAAALAIGAAVLSLPVGQAEAKPKIDMNPVYCMVTLDNGDIELFLPGDKVWDPLTGTAKTCGKDGNWHFESQPESPVAPRPGGGVLSK